MTPAMKTLLLMQMFKKHGQELAPSPSSEEKERADLERLVSELKGTISYLEMKERFNEGRETPLSKLESMQKEHFISLLELCPKQVSLGQRLTKEKKRLENMPKNISLVLLWSLIGLASAAAYGIGVWMVLKGNFFFWNLGVVGFVGLFAATIVLARLYHRSYKYGFFNLPTLGVFGLILSIVQFIQSFFLKSEKARQEQLIANLENKYGEVSYRISKAYYALEEIERKIAVMQTGI